MANQIVVSAGAKVRNLDGVLTGTSGVVNSLPINASNGIPQLDVNGKILVSQLPNSVMEYQGVWNANTNTPTLTNGGAFNQGDVYLCNVAGTTNFGAGPISFIVGDQAIYSGTIWQKAGGATGTVTSVAITESGDSLNITGSPITTSGTINIGFNGTNLQYVNGAGNLTTFPTLITSIGLSMPSAFSVANSPLTANGTIAVTGAGTTAQYIRGDGSLATFPTIATEAQRLITEVYNETGATLTKGTVVYINGGHGNLPTITKAIATGDATSAQTYGIVQTDINDMNNGYVVVIGSLTDLDTQAYVEGTQLYLSSTTAGAWTSVKQYAPAHLVYVGIVTRSHPTQGVVEVRIQNGFEMDELHNVSAQSPANGGILQYVTSTGLWTAVAGSTTNIAEGTNLYFTELRARGAISATAPLVYSSVAGTMSIDKADSSTNGYLSSTDWNTFNGKESALTFSYPLSRVGNTISIPIATASTDGYLTDTDWFIFNSKQAALSGTGFVKISGTTISYDNSTYYLASNPSAFIALTALSAGVGISYNNTTGVITNSAPDQVVALTASTGISVTGTYPNFTITNTSPSSGGTVTSVAALTIGTTGTDVTSTVANSTTTPVITLNIPSASATARGLVTTGTQTFAGVKTFNDNIGIAATPSAWNSAFNTIQIQSQSSLSANSSSLLLSRNFYVNSSGTSKYIQTGYATLYEQASGEHVWYTAPLFTGGLGDLTFTNVLRIGNTGIVTLYNLAGTGSRMVVADSTGVLSTQAIPTGTVTSVGLSSATSGVTIGSSPITTSGTITLAIATATTSQNGLLSSADWTTFNNKQSALTNPVTGTGTTNYLPKFTGTSTIGNSQIFDNGTQVGIGTITPNSYYSGADNLVIYQGTGEGGMSIVTANNTTGAIYFADGTTGDEQYRGGIAYTHTTDLLSFVTSGANKMYLTSSGNLGLGVTPSAWNLSGMSTMQIKNASISGYNNNSYLGANWSYISGDKYIATSAATVLIQDEGAYKFLQAPSGTAGAAITFTQAMTLDASGNFMLGGTTQLGKATIIGDNNDANSGQLVIAGATSTSKRTSIGYNTTSNYGFISVYTALSGYNALALQPNGGNVLIGTTTNDTYKLDVNGTGRFSGASYSAYLTLDAPTAGGVISFRNGGTEFGTLGSELAYYGSGSATTLSLAANTSKSLILGAGGSRVLTLASTGAATFSSSVTATEFIGIDNATLTANNFNTNATVLTINSKGTVGTIKLQTASTDRLTIASTGAATFSSSVTATQGFFNGFATNGTPSSAGTAQNFVEFRNTGGDFYIGQEGSVAGNFFTGSSAYASVFYGSTAQEFIIGGVRRLQIASTGAATFSSSVTATSFFESSDSRLKTLIQDNYQTKGIASITPKLYTKNGKVELGYYAQDFIGVLDSAVSKGSDDMLSLSYREVLVAKVYALEQEIKELKAKMN